jgi:hypothetical protein
MATVCVRASQARHGDPSGANVLRFDFGYGMAAHSRIGSGPRHHRGDRF